MKAKLAILTTVGLFSCHLALAQSDSAGSQAASPATTNQTAPTDATAPAAPAPAAAVAPAPAAEAAPAAPSTDMPPPAPKPATPVSEEVIPLIQFQDVQLTTAIENLARQAQLNYILDPKVGYGQPDEHGQPRPQPSISIRWENVTAEQALLALLGTYGLQLVEDPKTKIGRITIKDPALPDPLVTTIIQLKYSSVSNLVGSLQASLTDKRSRVIPDYRSGQVVVVATEKEQDAIQKMVDRLDTPTKQVLIEAQLIETSMNPTTAKGIDWSGTLQNQNILFGNGAPFAVQPTGPTVTPDAVNGGVTVTPGAPGLLSRVLDPNQPLIQANTLSGADPATWFLNADGVHAVLSFLNTAADARIIATPRAVVLDNEPVHLAVTRAEPIFSVQASTANTTGGSAVTYTNLGVILDVTPRITANNYINLRVTPEVSRVFATRTKTVVGTVNQADAYDLRRIDTTVMIPSGHTLVMGGLLQDDVRTGNTKVPLLGDIPFLGLAFRKDTKSRDAGNLMIFITPTVIDDNDFQVAAKNDFLKTEPKDNSEQKWSAWDDGKPWDWSKSGK